MKQIKIMGILNVTPDSFSDGGQFFTLSNARKRAEQMIVEGADIIDVGGESTRPGSDSISIEEELRRVIPVIRAIRKVNASIPISIDTYKSLVAEKALLAGATMVNSLGGFTFDPKIIKIVKKFKVPIIIYHIKGNPKTMQGGEIAYSDVVGEIGEFFRKTINLGLKNGLKKNQFILDPGIGFGKSVKHNVEIIKRLKEFQKIRLPILIGVSRKSHIGTLLEIGLKLSETPPPSERLEGSLAATAVSIWNGASIIRTHDVWSAKKFVCVLDQYDD